MESSSKAIPNTGPLLVIIHLQGQILAIVEEETDYPALLSCFPEGKQARYAAAVLCSCCVSSTSFFKEGFPSEMNYIEDQLLHEKKQLSWLMSTSSSPCSFSGNAGL